jgi:hypothetical protein
MISELKNNNILLIEKINQLNKLRINFDFKKENKIETSKSSNNFLNIEKNDNNSNKIKILINENKDLKNKIIELKLLNNEIKTKFENFKKIHLNENLNKFEQENKEIKIKLNEINNIKI